MANKKRKTLQIKRPNPNSPTAKKKPLPKVKMDEKAATSSVDTDELTSMGPESKPEGTKSNTTRVALPDEDKIRRARRANATQDLEQEGAMPSAEQIEQAQNSATMPIMIDTENIEESATQQIPSGDTDSNLDQTMEIDPDALATTNLETQLVDADDVEKGSGDQTMQIDEEALATRNMEEELAGAGKTDQTGDQTLKIDEGELEQSLEAEKLAAQDGGDEGDQTMEIDPEALKTQNLASDSPEEDAGDQTMQIDPAALQTGAVEEMDDLQAQETMKMETMQMEDGEVESELTRQEMEESFNAQTMEMDPGQLEKELASDSGAEADAAPETGADKTMDLSQKQRPKTIMIKRPSREGSSSSAPTVKAARPDAATIKASRPVTANPSQPKESTSRIDVPAEEGGASKEGKTIKLRRPAGGPSRAPSNVAGVASRAGLEVNEDGTVTAIAKQEAPLGGAWLAVAIVTLLVSLGALWTVASLSYPELPMPGRLVDVNDQLVPR